jgi:hypothetical protein
MAKFLDWFRRPKQDSQLSPEEKLRARKYVVEVGKVVGREEKDLLKGLGLRQGMWVTTDDGVGVVLGADEDFVKVQLVDDKGENRLAVNVYPHMVKQAKFQHIPKSRRDKIDPVVAKAYGYE